MAKRYECNFLFGVWNPSRGIGKKTTPSSSPASATDTLKLTPWNPILGLIEAILGHSPKLNALFDICLRSQGGQTREIEGAFWSTFSKRFAVNI
jgi:hypothetical protein